MTRAQPDYAPLASHATRGEGGGGSGAEGQGCCGGGDDGGRRGSAGLIQHYLPCPTFLMRTGPAGGCHPPPADAGT